MSQLPRRVRIASLGHSFVHGEALLPSRSRLACAVSAILAASVAVSAQAQTTSAARAARDTSDEIGEIIVSAQRREEDIQNVPVTIQVLTGETMSQLNVTTLQDFLRYLPNVTAAGAGPGQSNIFMRGLSTGSQSLQGSGGVGSFPNVAVYLDEQSAQVPGRNLDIYAADLERIEVLEGPQGTLFGAGAQAGVVRYITNKPKLDVTEANMNAGYGITSGGDPSSNLDAALNLALIPNTLAARMVIYDDRRGGYINNIPGTFSRAATDLVSVNYFSAAVPPNSGPINNFNSAASAFNPVTYKGGRAELLYKINDDWSALLMQSYQDMQADGVFWQEQYDGTGKTLPDLSVQLFNPSYDKDHFEDTQLTVNGRVGALKLVYAGGYLDRSIDQQLDYTSYSRGHYAGYYQCSYPGYPFINGKATPGSAGFCYSPSAYWREKAINTHHTHELRLSTPDDWRVRAIGGIYWEQYTIKDRSDWAYGSNPNLVPVAPPPGSTVNDPNPRPAGVVYLQDITRGYKQSAAFFSVDLDLLPKTLTLTLGTRYYRIADFENGSNVGSFGCEINGPAGAKPPNPCTVPSSNGNNLNSLNLNKVYTGFKSRANLTWHYSDEGLVYYTWSQGFRPGGFNLGQGIVTPSSPLYGIFSPPLLYGPDVLTNNELGWKSQWLGHRLQWNGAAYQEDWKDVQLTIFDPGVTGNNIFATNGPSYRVRGAETSLEARVTHELTLTGSASWNSSEVVKTLSLTNPTTGQPIPIANPYGALGSPLALSPPFQGNLRARYDFVMGNYQSFFQLGVSRTGGSYSTTDKLTKTLQGVSVAFYNPGFTTYEASVGVVKDAWSVSLFGENLTDTRGVPFSSYAEWVKANTIIRPRTLSLRFSYHFTDKK
jgi:iron complex outermembrane receptor protein